ncbi:type II toxin-antitoxin system RelE family toxin [Desulfobacula sp.]
MTYQVFLTQEAEDMLLAIRDRRVKKLLYSRAIKLQNSPEQQGKPLVRELIGLRSVRAVGQRYRIIYEIDVSRREVWVVTLGIRKEGNRGDVYEIASKQIVKKK